MRQSASTLPALRLHLRAIFTVIASGLSRPSPEVLPFFPQVLVVLHYHVGIRMAEEFSNLGYAHAVFQSIGGKRMAVGVGDNAFEIREFSPEVAEPAANRVSRPRLATTVQKQ